MNAIERQVAEIKRLQKAISKTSSRHLKNDYTKNLRILYEDLKEYCFWQKLDYTKVLKKHGL